ncbi:MAG: hypothetical protein ACT4QF_00450 [Sporichthyaceae bacterium]
MRICSIAASVAAVLVLGGCGRASVEDVAVAATPESTAPATGAGNAREFVAMLGSLVVYDYDPVATPAELRDDADLVVEGTIDSVAPSPTVGRKGDVGNHIVLGIRVQRVRKAPDGTPPETVRLEYRLPRNHPGRTIGTFRESLPVGARVVLFADRRAEQFEGERLYGQYPQGLFVEVDGKPVSVHTDAASGPAAFRAIETFDDLSRALDEPRGDRSS